MPDQIMIGQIIGIHIRAKHRRAMPKPLKFILHADDNRIVRRQGIIAERAFCRHGIVNAIAIAEYMISGIRHIIQVVSLPDHRAFRPMPQKGVSRYADINCKGIRHLMGDNALRTRIREIPFSVIIDKYGAINGIS